MHPWSFLPLSLYFFIFLSSHPFLHNSWNPLLFPMNVLILERWVTGAFSLSPFSHFLMFPHTFLVVSFPFFHLLAWYSFLDVKFSFFVDANTTGEGARFGLHVATRFSLVATVTTRPRYYNIISSLLGSMFLSLYIFLIWIVFLGAFAARFSLSCSSFFSLKV